MLEGIGKFRYAKKSQTGELFVPAAVVRDSQFPLKPGPVRIKIDPENRRVIVEPGQSGE